MFIGYACKAVAVPGADIKSCVLANATPERLTELIGHNLGALRLMLDYNIANRIPLFRISSDIFPFASSVGKSLPWLEIFKKELNELADLIRQNNLFVSMHPGQYTVLNSPDPLVVERAKDELLYHADFLDALSPSPAHKIILHIGGVYGDAQLATRRFVSAFQTLRPSIQRRLVLENDERCYNIGQVLAIAQEVGVPAVFDCLHHALNPGDIKKPEAQWITLCQKTWQAEDGPQKIHYSQQAVGKRPGSHSETIAIDQFLDEIKTWPLENARIMLEVKDKNLSALKCINAVLYPDQLLPMEREWARYKYAVLEHCPADYWAIRALFREGKKPLTLPFYRLVEHALAQPVTTGNATNALQHVWGYFKDKATPAEKSTFEKRLLAFQQGEYALGGVKRWLSKLTQIYHQPYLQQSGIYFMDKKGE